MRRSALVISLAALLAAAPARAAEPGTPAPVPPVPGAPASGAPTSGGRPAPAAKGLEFPANEPGRHAAAWFQAFNQGEAAMRKYIRTHVARAALERRTIEGRMESYRDMRKERGKVTALEVEAFTETSLKAIARGERGGRFAITFRCDEGAAHALLGLQVEDLPPEEGTPEGADDAEFSATPYGAGRPARVA